MGEIGSGSGSSYPGSLDTDSSVEYNAPAANKTKARASVVNDLAAAIVAIETELGIDPAGSAATVVARLAVEHNAAGTHSLVTTSSGIIAGGHSIWATDNTHDIGASGIKRPRDLYVARSGVFGGPIKAEGNSTIQTPGARVTHTVAQTIADAVNTILAFDSERWDTDSIHDTVTNNSRLTCKTAGKYSIVGHVAWASDVSGRRQLSVRLNGTTLIGSVQYDGFSSAQQFMTVTTIYDLAVNDYVELFVFQSSLNNVDIVKSNQYSPEFMMQKIG